MKEQIDKTIELQTKSTARGIYVLIWSKVQYWGLDFRVFLEYPNLDLAARNFARKFSMQ